MLATLTQMRHFADMLSQVQFFVWGVSVSTEDVSLCMSAEALPPLREWLKWIVRLAEDNSSWLKEWIFVSS